jgi:uncharacterized glyoxalase superfamily protein PhnB
MPEIVFDMEDKPYGERAFTCRDLERRIWNIDTQRSRRMV